MKTITTQSLLLFILSLMVSTLSFAGKGPYDPAEVILVSDTHQPGIHQDMTLDVPRERNTFEEMSSRPIIPFEKLEKMSTPDSTPIRGGIPYHESQSTSASAAQPPAPPDNRGEGIPLDLNVSQPTQIYRDLRRTSRPPSRPPSVIHLTLGGEQYPEPLPLGPVAHPPSVRPSVVSAPSNNSGNNPLPKSVGGNSQEDMKLFLNRTGYQYMNPYSNMPVSTSPGSLGSVSKSSDENIKKISDDWDTRRRATLDKADTERAAEKKAKAEKNAAAYVQLQKETAAKNAAAATEATQKRLAEEAVAKKSADKFAAANTARYAKEETERKARGETADKVREKEAARSKQNFEEGLKKIREQYAARFQREDEERERQAKEEPARSKEDEEAERILTEATAICQARDEQDEEAERIVTEATAICQARDEQDEAIRLVKKVEPIIQVLAPPAAAARARQADRYEFGLPYRFQAEQGQFRDQLVRLYKDLYKISPHGENVENARLMGMAAIEGADEAYTEGRIDDANFSKELATDFLNIAIGLDPVTGVARSAYELWTGKNFVTGEVLSNFELSLSFVGLATLGTGSSIKQAANIVTKLFQKSPKFVKLAPKALSKVIESGRKILDSAGSLGIKGKETMKKFVSEFKRIAGNNIGSVGHDIEEVAQKANRTLHEKYLEKLRREMGKPHVVDKSLTKTVEKLYRPNAKLGSGSTAEAIRHERLFPGEKVGGSLHSQKGTELLQKLKDWIAENPNSILGDKAAAENIIKDLENALFGDVSKWR